MINKDYNNHLVQCDDVARDKQKLPNGKWAIWLLLAGRGFGKTRTGAENVMQLIIYENYKYIGIIGKSIQEAKQIMVEGPCGLLSTTLAQYIDNINKKDKLKIKYLPSKKQIEFTNGAKAYLLNGDRPDSIRGYQFDLVWIDEFAKFNKPSELFDQVMFSLRMGKDTKCIITTTPKPIQILKQLTTDPTVIVTKGSTFENSNNLSTKFIKIMKDKYSNVTLGRQELEGELIMDKERTLWRRENIIYKNISLDYIERIVIGVDPAVTASKYSDETGIIIAGQGYDTNFYVIDDLSGKYSGPEWAKKVVRAAYDYKVQFVVVETNNGGDLVVENLKSLDSTLPIKKTHAVKGKIVRAEPISILYESNRVWHRKEFRILEDQMCNMSYDENDDSHSPDRVDALVWAISALRNMYQNDTKFNFELF